MKAFITTSLAALIALSIDALCGTGFRVTPYLQNPSPGAMSIRWLSETASVGQLRYHRSGGPTNRVASRSAMASELDYHVSEHHHFAPQPAPSTPYMHRVRLTNLVAGAWYSYRVTQRDEVYSNRFRAPPGRDESIRFAVYADCETEPESTGAFREWPDPSGKTRGRPYLLDQTDGYSNNLAVIQSRNPDLAIIAGDITEAGGEQRDWDEFWKHNAGTYNDLGGRLPILAAPGNHEYYGGTAGGRTYSQPGSETAVSKYLAYFENPPNGTEDSEQHERFFRVDYGPATFIFIDSCNGADTPGKDTNFRLSTFDGAKAPDFNPGSVQYAWLESELADAQKVSRFTFATFHHCPYSVGPHADPNEGQTSVPLQVLTPLFHRYGVDAVFCGHDEMYEHSRVPEKEIQPGGRSTPHDLHVYDVGIGGDGLRGPVPGLENPFQVFLAHTDSPEVWRGDRLVDGGKHYGHLEVNIEKDSRGHWQARISPVYVFPIRAEHSKNIIKCERRVYDDELIITPAVIAK
jgi:3',5'-cyclic AMP phosphodiesterase CpdA